MKVPELVTDISEYGKMLGWYGGRKLRFVAGHFEGAKGLIVDVLKARRGTYQKPFLHVGMVALTILAVFSAQFILETYPSSMSVQAVAASDSPSALLNDQADITNIDTVTKESDKPRRDVVNYVVQGGDTLISIAKKFSNEKLGIIVDADSIAYLNDFETDKTLRPGDTIKIPPVAGVIVTVKSGDTIYTLAKKYGLPTAEPIINWPYNTYADDEKFSLTAGQMLVIPGGKAPEAVPTLPPVARTPQGNLLPGGSFSGGSGQFAWPVTGIITQYFAWYHTGLDIANSLGMPVFAADSGRVIESTCGYNGGYGCHILINHGNGYVTMYGHLSALLASVGQDVSRGTQIGRMGSTGRSTGPHLHFEVRKNGGFLNPSGFLK